MTGWDDKSVLYWVNIALALATAASSAGALRFFFVTWRQTTVTKAAFTVSILVCQAVQFIALVLSRDVPLVWQVLGVLGYVSANLLFWWSVRAYGKHPPAVAFAPAVPTALVLDGPYRYVRHPFYASYLLAWLAGCAATANPWLLLTVVWMFGFYYVAARGEEESILQSGLADVYREYRKQTGMFLPKVV
jgi:protein-S-isoprenylcysteine O-methyltransferase Ste14